jgi:hypothetical protein
MSALAVKCLIYKSPDQPRIHHEQEGTKQNPVLNDSIMVRVRHSRELRA